MQKFIRYTATFGLALVMAAALLPTTSWAQCPGAYGNAMISRASYNGTAANKLTFIGSGCTTVKVGGANAPTNCLYNNNTIFPTIASWVAFWPTNPYDANAGCQFNCQNGSCFVRSTDGLPVELLSFGVE